MRVRFDEVFEIKNGAISPKHVVNLGGVQMGPGVSFGGGVSFGNVNIAEHVGKDLEVEQDKATGVVTILKIYN